LSVTKQKQGFDCYLRTLFGFTKSIPAGFLRTPDSTLVMNRFVN